jgi:hypothetical protein
VNSLFAVLSLAIPMVLAVVVRSASRSIVYGTVAVWVLMVAGAQYNRATDPQYDSLVPGISIVAGWIPGLIYSGLCVSMVTAVLMVSRRLKSNQ